MGLAFKENCPDVRNTRVVDIVSDLASYNAQVDVYDPCVNPEEARHEYGISLITKPKPAHYDAIVIAVGHRQFADMGGTRIHALGKPKHVLYDINTSCRPESPMRASNMHPYTSTLTSPRTSR